MFNPHLHGVNLYIQVIYENKGDKDDILPHVICVAREKWPNINHHYKAGAMNVMVTSNNHIKLINVSEYVDRRKFKHIL